MKHQVQTVAKLVEIEEGSNDIYVLEALGDGFLINDNYNGVKLLDGNLSLKKRLEIPPGTMVYHAYPEPGGSAVVLYCPENDYLIILSPLEEAVRVLDFTLEGVLSTVHTWEGSNLIVSTYDGHFLGISGSGVIHLEPEVVRMRLPGFFSLSRLALSLKVWDTNAADSLVYEDAGQVIYYDHKRGSRSGFPRDGMNAHHITSDGTHAVFVAEGVVHVVSRWGQVFDLPVKESRMYMRARFASPGVFALLSSEQGNPEVSYIEKFCIR